MSDLLLTCSGYKYTNCPFKEKQQPRFFEYSHERNGSLRNPLLFWNDSSRCDCLWMFFTCGLVCTTAECELMTLCNCQCVGDRTNTSPLNSLLLLSLHQSAVPQPAFSMPVTVPVSNQNSAAAAAAALQFSNNPSGALVTTTSFVTSTLTDPRLLSPQQPALQRNTVSPGLPQRPASAGKSRVFSRDVSLTSSFSHDQHNGLGQIVGNILYVLLNVLLLQMCKVAPSTGSTLCTWILLLAAAGGILSFWWYFAAVLFTTPVCRQPSPWPLLLAPPLASWRWKQTAWVQ